jgi:hypothetical protein
MKQHMKQPNKPKATKAILDALYGTQDFKSFRGDTDYTEPKIRSQKRNKSKLPKDTEHEIQRKIIVWFRKKYPNHKDCICYNDTNKHNKTSQMISKSLGLVTGRNDLSIYYRGYALLLEIKTEKGIQSENQKIFEQNMKNANNNYRVAYDFDLAKETITKFIEWCDEK